MGDKKKKYQTDDTLSIRLTPKAGTTDDVLEFLSKSNARAKDIIKAMKFYIRYEEGQAVDKVKLQIEQEAIMMEQTQNKYGQNRGKYKKKNKK